MFVGPLEARKMTFVVSYNQGYRRMRGVWRRMQICMHIWGYIFWLSWQCSNWRRSVASSRMNLAQISFRFVFDWKTHSQAFRKHLKHLKLKFRARKYAYANFCGNMSKGVWRRIQICMHIWRDIFDFHDNVQTGAEASLLAVWTWLKYLLGLFSIEKHTRKLFGNIWST